MLLILPTEIEINELPFFSFKKVVFQHQHSHDHHTHVNHTHIHNLDTDDGLNERVEMDETGNGINSNPKESFNVDEENYVEESENDQVSSPHHFHPPCTSDSLICSKNDTADTNVTSTNNLTHNGMHPNSPLLSYLLTIMLALETIISCVAIGISSTYKNAVVTLIAVLSHIWAESFTLTVSYTKANFSRKKVIFLLILFSSSAPLSILLGMILEKIGDQFIEIAQSTLISFAAGVFVYVSIVEILVEELNDSSPPQISTPNYKVGRYRAALWRYSRFGCFCVGFSLMSCLAIWF